MTSKDRDIRLLRDVSCVIFDLDGTLYTSPFLKVSMALRLWRSLPYLSRLEAARDHVRSQDFSDGAALLQAFSAALDPRRSELALRWYQKDFYPQFISSLRPGLRRPHLLESLQKLSRARKKLAVLSDYGCVRERLERLGIPPGIFTSLMSAEGTGALKPQARSYLALAEILGCSPASILLVGDRFETDGLAAQTLGFPYFSVTSPKEWQSFIRAVEAL